MCEKLFQFIKEQNYDIVIMDTAPIGTVIDAAILTRYADGAALVIEVEVTSRRLFQRAKEQLDRTGVKFLGVILNKVNMTKSGYYNSYYSYHKYGKSMESAQSTDMGMGSIGSRSKIYLFVGPEAGYRFLLSEAWDTGYREEKCLLTGGGGTAEL